MSVTYTTTYEPIKPKKKATKKKAAKKDE